MKTAVSIPDELFEAMEEHARVHAMTRSRLVQNAVREYLANRQRGEITRRVNDVLATMTDEELEDDRSFARAASARSIRRAEW